MECDISGQMLLRSWATQLEIFPNVVAGEACTAVLPVSRNSLWCFSKRSVAPREEPILIPKTSSADQPACFTASLDASKAYSTELSRLLYLGSEFFKTSTSCFC